jgi:nucleotide-binding universal stress UspA family protein
MTSQPGQRQPYRIVVGVDGSEGSRAALRWAGEEAALRDAELEAVMARVPVLPMVLFGPGSTPVPTSTEPLAREDPDRTDEEVLRDVLRGVFGDQPPSRLTWYVEDGHPAGLLLSRSTDADLLVVGARGHGGFSGLLAGSVSEQCVRHAGCSVVVVRAKA